ncbi:capsid protein [Bactrocera dorsalis toti-like virus 1]|uniref:Capsid protein n=1 Tax=Bactrocera dorsalis toti-like virus 1 TaxID=2760897 RepID=A0A7G4YW90_9VIRU|nr:capsid protein [Bactrocera dorsalis toti-like virus 1]
MSQIQDLARKNLSSWFSNPLPGVGDRILPITGLGSAPDQTSQSSGRKCNLISHNTQPRAYVTSYSQLLQGSLGLQSGGSSNDPNRSISSDSEDEEETEQYGLTLAEYKRLSEPLKIMVLQRKSLKLIGQKSLIKRSRAEEYSWLVDDKYTSEYFTHIRGIVEHWFSGFLVSGKLPTSKVDEACYYIFTTHADSLRSASKLINNRTNATAAHDLSAAIKLTAETARDADTCATVFMRSLGLDKIVGKKWDHFYFNRASEVAAPQSEETPARHTATCEIVPIHHISAEYGQSHLEQTSGIPESTLMSTLRIRLQDQTASSALSSMIKGPTVRDAQTMLSLSRLQLDEAGTVMDVLPMLRLGCIALSTERTLYEADPTPEKFVSDSSFSLDSLTYVQPDDVEYLSVAMSLDVFVAWMSGRSKTSIITCNGEDTCFSTQGIDINWVGVPVRNGLLSNRGILPYLLSHLDSYVWSGRMVLSYKGTNSGAKDYSPEITTMPAANSVHLPGQRNFIIILIDQNTTSEDYVNIDGVAVPVWNFKLPTTRDEDRRTVDVPPVDFFGVFSDALANGGFSEDMGWADAELARVSSVLGSAQLGRSLAASLYSAWRPGYYTNPDKDPKRLHGSLVPSPISSGDVWTKLSSCSYEAHNILSNHGDLCALQMNAFNFTATNSLGLSPSGYAIASDAHTWANIAESVPQYHVQCAATMARLRVHLGLYQRGSEVITFSPKAYGSWLHMQSCALSASTSAYHVTNDIRFSEWCGLHSEYDPMLKDIEIANAKNSVFWGIIKHVDTSHLYSTWDENNPVPQIYAVYKLGKKERTQLFTHSPIPSVLTLQWCEKIGIQQATTFPAREYFERNRVMQSGLPITQNSGTTKITICATTDAEQYLPSIYYSGGSIGSKRVFQWIDKEAFDSTVAMQQYSTSNAGLYMSKTITIAQWPLGSGHLRPDNIFVSASNAEHTQQKYFQINFTSLIWPDPPSTSGPGNSQGSMGAGSHTAPETQIPPTRLNTTTLRPDTQTDQALEESSPDPRTQRHRILTEAAAPPVQPE